jgi:CheY-like chemotaxis protein
MINKTPNILIVDDNPENIRVLGAALSSYEYEITVATNGEDALNAVEEESPDLILLDVMMPVIDGFEVCRRLKANPKTQAIEIIFVTAVVSPSEELKGLALGAVDYIHKPYSIPIVQAKVALHLERGRYKRQLEENAKLREEIEVLTRHDLKRPLNDLLFYSQLMLSDKELSAKTHLNLEAVLKASIDILRKINDSQDLFKMETGCYQCNPTKIELLSILNRILKDSQTLLESKNITLHIRMKGTQVKEDCFFVLAEESLCYLLFTHLIHDAIDACNGGDVIIIAVHHENNEAVISMTNPETIPESIRTTFFAKQTPPDSEKVSERGIFADYIATNTARGKWQGVYLAKLMTDTQNGSIAMITNEQETCITVRLPFSN